MATGTVILPVQSAKIGGGFITAGARIDGGDGPWKLLYDASSTQSALWQFRVPSDYSSGPVLKVISAMASAVTGKIDLEIDVMAITPTDLADVDTASFDTINEISGGTTVAVTAGYTVISSITMTNFDSGAAGDLIMFRLHRDHDDADDTATGDAEVLAVSLEYTTS